MSDYHAVLVYDGECPFCSAAASALRRLPGVGAIAWDEKSVQSFLRAQFGDTPSDSSDEPRLTAFGETPFALVLADGEEETVYVGREAARELCERAGMPVLIRDIVGDNYESIADAVRTVTKVDEDPDAHHGVFPMSDDATVAFDELAGNAWHTAKVRE